MHSEREITWSTVLLKARLFQDPSVGQLWFNVRMFPQYFQKRNALSGPLRNRASDMTDLLGWRPKSSLDSQGGK